MNKKVPQNVRWINDGLFFVSQPRRNNHLGHFIEGINQALLKLRFPSKYPKFTDWYITKFGNNEFEWTKIFLQLLYNLFPDDSKPVLHLANSIPLKQETCFRSVVCIWNWFFVDIDG